MGIGRYLKGPRARPYVANQYPTAVSGRPCAEPVPAMKACTCEGSVEPAGPGVPGFEGAWATTESGHGGAAALAWAPGAVTADPP